MNFIFRENGFDRGQPLEIWLMEELYGVIFNDDEQSNRYRKKFNIRKNDGYLADIVESDDCDFYPDNLKNLAFEIIKKLGNDLQNTPTAWTGGI